MKRVEALLVIRQRSCLRSLSGVGVAAVQLVVLPQIEVEARKNYREYSGQEKGLNIEV